MLRLKKKKIDDDDVDDDVGGRHSILLQVDAEKDIFEKKNDRGTSFHKEQLKDHVAHRHVLNNIARAKVEGATGGRADSHLGHYGLGASKLEIQPLIDQRIKDNTSSAKRKKQSFKIQNKRRAVKVFDRTKSTSALLKMKPEVRTGSCLVVRLGLIHYQALFLSFFLSFFLSS